MIYGKLTVKTVKCRKEGGVVQSISEARGLGVVRGDRYVKTGAGVE